MAASGGNQHFYFLKKISAGEIKCPRAVVCINEIMEINLCQSLQNCGIKLPDDIAVTAYDGSLCTLLTKSAITTVCGGEKSFEKRKMRNE